jgi:hypothetical protein
MIIQERIQTLLSRIDYKGYEYAFSYKEGDPYGKFNIYRREIDATDKYSQPAKFVTTFDIPIEVLQFMNDDSIFEMVFAATLRVELHEVKEFFKIDGKPYKDAHGPIELLGTVPQVKKTKILPGLEKIKKDHMKIDKFTIVGTKFRGSPPLIPYIQPAIPGINPFSNDPTFPYGPLSPPTLIDRKCD